MYCSPAGSSVHGDSPGKNIGVGCRALFPDPGIKPVSPALQTNSLPLSHQGSPRDCSTCIETTSLGAAYLAGLAVGYWRDLADVDDNWQVDRVFSPAMPAEERQEKLAGWQDAVSRTLGWGR